MSGVVIRVEEPWLFRRASAEPEITYESQSDRCTLEDYLSRNPTTGLLIAKDDTILFEHYRYARTDRHRLLSQSMAKTITPMLIGVAVAEGAIKSIDDTAATYVPQLAGSEYGNTALRDLLHMASGVAFSENYDGNDDSSRLAADLGSRKRAVDSVTQFNTGDVPAYALGCGRPATWQLMFADCFVHLWRRFAMTIKPIARLSVFWQHQTSPSKF
jgi:hypothetical protein